MRSRVFVLSIACCVAGLAMFPHGLLAAALPARQPAAALEQTTGAQASVEERLGRVRNDVFTRPDRLDASVRELHQLLTLYPALAEAHLLLGLTHVGRGTDEMRAEAVAEFRQALEIEPRLTPARFYLARVYLELGLVGRARDELERTLQDLPGNAQFLAVLSDAERRLGHPDRAIDYARQALAAQTTLSEARFYLGLALLDADRQDEGIVELERVAATDATRAEIFVSLGAAYLDAGRLDSAITALAKGIAMGPPKPDVRISLARAYRLNGQLTNAQQQLDLALPPGTPMQASAYYQQMDADVSLEQGLIHLALNRLVAARQAITKALEINPSLGRAHQYLAEIYVAQSEFERAADHARRAREAGTPASSAVEAAIASRSPLPPKGSSR